MADYFKHAHGTIFGPPKRVEDHRSITVQENGPTPDSVFLFFLVGGDVCFPTSDKIKRRLFENERFFL